jgi:cell division protein ZapE
MSDPAAPGPIARHRALVAEGRLTSDPAQALAAEKLQLLHGRLRGWSPGRPKRVARGLFGFGRKAAKADSPLGGLYLYGGVGRGKSMLMDLFFDTAPVRRKRRVHFHAFMQEVQAGVDHARRDGVDDPIAGVADEVADGAALLCFDELQVTDIADAMILGRLFQALFARGVVVVATSNRAPDALYENGLNRALFLPFIALIKDRLDVHELGGDVDHRRRDGGGPERWRAPLDAAAERAMDEAWEALTGGAEPRPLSLRVHGRELRVPAFAEGVARAGFDELCARPLGPADHLALAEAADALILDRVPRLSRERPNEAKRFVTLIDALYEKGAALYASAEVEPEALFTEGEGAFEFARAASRLAELRRGRGGG